MRDSTKLNKKVFQDIAIYLSGSFPRFYKMPNRLEIIFLIREYDPTNFNDTMLSLLSRAEDAEYYFTLIESFYLMHKGFFHLLLQRMEVPKEVAQHFYR